MVPITHDGTYYSTTTTIFQRFWLLSNTSEIKNFAEKYLHFSASDINFILFLCLLSDLKVMFKRVSYDHIKDNFQGDANRAVNKNGNISLLATTASFADKRRIHRSRMSKGPPHWRVFQVHLS